MKITHKFPFTPLTQLAAALLLLGSAASAGSPAIKVSPAQSLMDEPVRIRLSGLPAQKQVELRASARYQNQLWMSRAVFTSRRDGTVDLAKQAPVSGSYSGVDPMGLFWSMDPTKSSGAAPSPKITEPVVFRLDLEMDGQPVASLEMTRWWARPGVKVTEVREDGLIGRLFEPTNAGRHPALLVLSGSEGGISEREAALLASHGYTAFALAYFGIDGLPPELIEIPLEYLNRGISRLRARPSVDPSRVGVIGGSKGGELALLLGATYPDIKVVVARAPSHAVWMGIRRAGAASQSSWTHEGKPLPFVPARVTPAFLSQFSSSAPIRLIELYRTSLENREAVARALIPVEKINGAVLLLSGKDDQMWPASVMSDLVMERLKEHRHPFPHKHLVYESAGHSIPSAYIPIPPTLGRLALGGEREANAKAQADSRPKVLEFLRKNLAKR